MENKEVEELIRYLNNLEEKNRTEDSSKQKRKGLELTIHPEILAEIDNKRKELKLSKSRFIELTVKYFMKHHGGHNDEQTRA